MDFASLDLNLLRVFDAIMGTRNLTAGGERVNLSQPAMSNALLRLRAHFDDPLFVRSGHGMTPTDLASAIAGPIHEALETLDRSLRMQAKFDATKSDREFHICTTDVGGLVLLPYLLIRLGRAAPGIRLRVGQYPMREVRDAFLTGDLDLAIGYMPELNSGIYQQRLFEETYVVIARGKHPRVRERPDLAHFIAESHIVVQSPGTGHSHLREVLEASKCRIQLEVRDFACAPLIVSTTDLIASVPSRLAAVSEKPLNLRVYPHPLDLPSFAIRQFWHERNHHDAANIWLRHQLLDLFGPGSSLLGFKSLSPAAPVAEAGS